jgi:sec-independent protein translocase protein TatC
MSDQESTDQPLPLVTHLTELRDKLLRALLAVLIVFICLFPFANDIYTFVSEPLRALLPPGATMIATEVASPFFTPFKLSLVTAVFLAMPYVLYQAWSFIAPGMYKHEKRLAIPLLASSVLLFYAGSAFAYYVVFPLIFAFFTSVAPQDITIMTDINSYLNFVLKLFFAFGLAFEIPIVAILMIWAGITTAEALAKKRPYIILKWAESTDGFIAPLSKSETKPVWISNPQSRQLVHQWRAEEQAILVGANTVIKDNPRLTTRAVAGPNPIRVVIDLNNSLPDSSHIFNSEAKTIRLTSNEVDTNKPLAEQLCAILYEHHITSIIIEGGQKTLQTFIDANFWDEARIFSSELNLIAGVRKPKINGTLVTTKRIESDTLKTFIND